MTATVHTLVIPTRRQDALAHEINIQRLSRQHQQAAWRKEVLENIAKAEAQIEYYQSVVDFGLCLLARMDGGPSDAA